MKTNVLTNGLCISMAIFATGYFHTAGAQGPNAPTGLVAQPIVNVSWSGTTGVSYNIYCSGTGGFGIIGTGTTQQITVTSPGTYSGTFNYWGYTDTSEPNAPCNYNYTISGSNSSGNSAQSGSCAIDNPLAYYPNPGNRPHIISYITTGGTMVGGVIVGGTMVSGTMGYTDANGVVQTVTLKPVPLSGYFGGSGSFQYVAAYKAVVIHGSNATLSGYDFNGMGILGIYGDNITISCNYFHGYTTGTKESPNYWVIQGSSGTTSVLTVTDNLLSGPPPIGTGTGPINGLVYTPGNTANMVIERNLAYNTEQTLHISSNGDGLQPYTNIIADNYFYALSGGGTATSGSNQAEHCDQIYMGSGTGGLLVSHNHFTGPDGQTSAIHIVHDNGNTGNITIDDNLFDGYPQYTIYAGASGTDSSAYLLSSTGNFQITNNKFDSSYGQNPGIAGGGTPPGCYVIDPAPGDPRLFLQGNVYYPSMTLISGTAWNQ